MIKFIDALKWSLKIKGKSKQDYNAWTVEESRMLLQLMVDATSCGWRDANGMLSKATLLRHSSRFGWDPITKKFTAPEEVWKDHFKSHPKDTSIQTKTCEDHEDLQIVIGNATAIGRNSLGLGHSMVGVYNRHCSYLS
ncbi:hypothetical protein L3X38_038668 [Prunus dulcis]|uniref:Myb/SANT-like domain-containing protein n=1 Tax=Prunus dulcis TaxID=3755 RepID=A0AAD4V5G8_PRUDU|nr:hypothetical protein L3X38_038668 [Prunus dulcis]